MLLGCLLLEMRVEACKMHWICSNHFADLCRLEFRAKGTEQGGMCPTDNLNLLPCNPDSGILVYVSSFVGSCVLMCIVYGSVCSSSVWLLACWNLYSFSMLFLPQFYLMREQHLLPVQGDDRSCIECTVAIESRSWRWRCSIIFRYSMQWH